MSTEKLNILLKWFDDNNVKWNKKSLSIKQVEGSFCIIAQKNMKKDESIVKIPKEVVLSTKTCGISNILDEANLEGGCPLALALLYEIAQKENSPWYGYLQSLPDQRQDLPMFWEEDEKEWFKGTEMESSVYNDLADLEDDYNDLVEPLLEEHPYIFTRGEEDPYSFENFVNASTLISSRAFEVDAFHETALVPFADLFNHRASDEHVHFETESQVCEACGVLEFCEHQYFNFLEEDEEDKEDGDEKEDGEGEWEDEDEDEHDSDEDMEEEETELPDLDELEKNNVNFWDKEEEEEEKDSCEMVLDRDVKAGQEIFNTYGEHPNVALLSKYGFCSDDNKNDYVTISEDSIVDCCLAITLELLKSKHPKASKEELEEMAVNETRPRWELFLRHEQLLCPSKDDGHEEGPDDFEEDCEDECCGEDDHQHDHNDENEHVHDEEGGCCGGEEEEGGPSRPYFVNAEGLFEDKVMCLLHIMFVDEVKFKKFVENVDNALEYFDELSKNQGSNTKSMTDVKRVVYQACHALVDFRRMEYFEDNGEWKPIKQDIEERKQVPEGSRKYYAMTCRINEKKIIERSVEYYESMVKGCSAPSASSSNKKQKRPVKSKK